VAGPTGAPGKSSAAALGIADALRINPTLLRVVAVILMLLGMVLIVAAPFNNWQDWGVIWSGGATVGGPDLVDASRHAAWQGAHGILPSFWKYPPATAYLLWPFAQLPVDVSFWVQAVLMFACIVAAGRLAARIYGFTPELGILAALAWGPCTASVATGQNAPLALLLAMLAIRAMQSERPWLAGAAAGLLLYKPTLALGLILLFIVRGRWRELSVVAVAGVMVFLLSVAAAGGDWNWLATWVEGAKVWLPPDAIWNADKAITLPGLLSRLPVPWVVPVLGGVALAVAAVPGLRRAGIVEAASAACLLGLAAGPRAWGYEAALAFPFVCWVLAGGIAEPWRTRLIVVAYLLCPLWMVSLYIGLNGVAVVVLAASLLWLWRWRPWRPRDPVPVAQAEGPR
jgi:phage shock protein PspC (stress-responsive transcriptional regulator)